MSENMSPKLAPPVARQGEPKNPWRNRSTRRPPILLTNAVGTVRMTNNARVAMYGGLRPMEGISLKGAQSMGPRPYASTYRARPSEATVIETPNAAITPGSLGAYIAEPIYTARV